MSKVAGKRGREMLEPGPKGMPFIAALTVLENGVNPIYGVSSRGSLPSPSSSSSYP